MAVPHLLDAVFDDDEVTAQHAPTPELLHEARARSARSPASDSVSGVAVIHRPPPPSQRRILPLDALRRLRDLYADYIGPAARPLLLSAISSLHATPERFPVMLKGQLLNALCSCFDDPKIGRAFFEDAVRLLDEE